MWRKSMPANSRFPCSTTMTNLSQSTTVRSAAELFGSFARLDDHLAEHEAEEVPDVRREPAGHSAQTSFGQSLFQFGHKVHISIRVNPRYRLFRPRLNLYQGRGTGISVID